MFPILVFINFLFLSERPGVFLSQFLNFSVFIFHFFFLSFSFAFIVLPLLFLMISCFILFLLFLFFFSNYISYFSLPSYIPGYICWKSEWNTAAHRTTRNDNMYYMIIIYNFIRNLSYAKSCPACRKPSPSHGTFFRVPWLKLKTSSVQYKIIFYIAHQNSCQRRPFLVELKYFLKCAARIYKSIWMMLATCSAG